MALHTKVTGEGPDGQYLSISPLFAGEGESTTVPKHRMPDGPMSPEMAYEIIHDELMLDGNARLNLATFVTTWMEPQAEKLMAECLDKNMIDKDEYPQTAELEMRCVNILSRLWNSPEHRFERRDARPPAPARPPCSEGWPSSAAGSRGDARPERASSGPTWSWG